MNGTTVAHNSSATILETSVEIEGCRSASIDDGQILEVERHYNPGRLPSALGYRSPGEFEKEKGEAGSDVAGAAAMMTFLGR